MKITHPTRGTKRIVKGFLFFPVRIGLESRWLETATYEEEFKENYPCEDAWFPIRWVNK